MAKAQPKVEDTPEVTEVVTPEATPEDTPEVTPPAPVAVNVLLEGVKSGSSYTLPNGTVVTNN